MGYATRVRVTSCNDLLHSTSARRDHERRTEQDADVSKQQTIGSWGMNPGVCPTRHLRHVGQVRSSRLAAYGSGVGSQARSSRKIHHCQHVN